MIDPAPETNLARTLNCLAAVCGREPLVAIIRDLLSSDRSVQTKAAERLRKTTCLENAARPAILRKTPLRVEAILRHTLDKVLGQANAILQDTPTDRELPPPVNAYSGTAGIIMELAQHPSALVVATELAKCTVNIVESIHAPPALMYGRAGTGLAIKTVANATRDASLHAAADAIMPGEEDVANAPRVDVTHGLAGLGIGFLAFAAMGSGAQRYLVRADLCATRLIDGEAMIDEQLRALPVGNASHGISVADGFAHGRAGIACFLLTHAAQRDDEKSRWQARQLVDQLTDLVPVLVSRAGTPQARPMAASWCQGLAGIGTTLVCAARILNDGRVLTVAKSAAAACMRVAPGMPLVTQCCGLAGVGEFLLDLAVAADDVRYRRDAIEILRLMLMRSGGSSSTPSFPDNTMAASTPGWGIGTSGVLSFLRRLVDPSSSRLWMPGVPPASRTTSGERPSTTWSGLVFRSGSQ